MILHLVIGKHSNLSNQLSLILDNVVLVSTLDVAQELNNVEFSQYEKINIIFNNFQTATALNNVEDPVTYISRAILSTSQVLEYIKMNHIPIHKMIYTSSSSVYGNNIFCSESDEVKPLNLHASLKVSNEKLIEKFSQDNAIDYTVARVFNMYGGNDEFSIISKMIYAYQNNETLTIVNNGNGIRDFIHIDDVVLIYKKLLFCSDVPCINIGTGEGISIKNIIDYLKNHHIDLKFNTIQRQELKTSTANNELLIEAIDNHVFKKVEQYIVEELIV